jgi:hypothetical protein
MGLLYHYCIFQNIAELKHLAISLLNKKMSYGEIKSKRCLENSCYRSNQTTVPSSLFSEFVKSEIQKYIILPVLE